MVLREHRVLKENFDIWWVNLNLRFQDNPGKEITRNRIQVIVDDEDGAELLKGPDLLVDALIVFVEKFAVQ